VSDARETFTIVLGYDGSESAQRGVERVCQLAVERATVVVVAVAPEVRSAGLGTELVGRAVDTDLLLAEAGELLAAREDAAIQGRSAIGDPAVVLIDVAREVVRRSDHRGSSRPRFRRSYAARPGRRARRAACAMRRARSDLTAPRRAATRMQYLAARHGSVCVASGG
jgi:universal stress protein family protein